MTNAKQNRERFPTLVPMIDQLKHFNAKVLYARNEQGYEVGQKQAFFFGEVKQK